MGIFAPSSPTPNTDFPLINLYILVTRIAFPFKNSHFQGYQRHLIQDLWLRITLVLLKIIWNYINYRPFLLIQATF